MIEQGEGEFMTKRIGVYPGTFDPITNGHADDYYCARSRSSTNW